MKHALVQPMARTSGAGGALGFIDRLVFVDPVAADSSVDVANVAGSRL